MSLAINSSYLGAFVGSELGARRRYDANLFKLAKSDLSPVWEGYVPCKANIDGTSAGNADPTNLTVLGPVLYYMTTGTDFNAVDIRTLQIMDSLELGSKSTLGTFRSRNSVIDSSGRAFCNYVVTGTLGQNTLAEIDLEYFTIENTELTDDTGIDLQQNDTGNYLVMAGKTYGKDLVELVALSPLGAGPRFYADATAIYSISSDSYVRKHDLVGEQQASYEITQISSVDYRAIIKHGDDIYVLANDTIDFWIGKFNTDLALVDSVKHLASAGYNNICYPAAVATDGTHLYATGLALGIAEQPAVMKIAMSNLAITDRWVFGRDMPFAGITVSGDHVYVLGNDEH